LRLPYAAMIGTLVGVINIIPMIGAFIGGAIGCFLVFTVSPWKALVFLIFLCVLQQIESNVFYPRIVGKSIGLPGIYVTMVVVIGGSLAGIPGMLIGIPLAAALYRLAKEHVMHAEREAGLEPFDSSGQEKSPKPSSRL
jgi:predicted PurR-regulated permease PerM